MQPLDILYRAAAEPIGLLLSVEGDIGAARQLLYRTRAARQDIALSDLQFRLIPGLDGIVICHQRCSVRATLLELL